MPDAIRIDSLPVLQSEEPRDLINFQRLVDGTWQDFHTDLGTFYGELRTFVHTYELDTFDTQVLVYSPEADELAVPIGLIVKYTPGDNPTGNVQNISFDAETQGAVLAEFLNGSNPLVIQPIDIGSFGGLGTDLLLNLTSNGGNGTAVCIATYAVLTNINGPIDGVVVEGAGTTELNGLWLETGTRNGYPEYTKADVPTRNIAVEEGIWIIGSDFGALNYYGYTSTRESPPIPAFPWLEPGYQANEASEPAPTVVRQALYSDL